MAHVHEHKSHLRSRGTWRVFIINGYWVFVRMIQMGISTSIAHVILTSIHPCGSGPFSSGKTLATHT